MQYAKQSIQVYYIRNNVWTRMYMYTTKVLYSIVMQNKICRYSNLCMLIFVLIQNSTARTAIVLYIRISKLLVNGKIAYMKCFSLFELGLTSGKVTQDNPYLWYFLRLPVFTGERKRSWKVQYSALISSCQVSYAFITLSTLFTLRVPTIQGYDLWHWNPTQLQERSQISQSACVIQQVSQSKKSTSNIST